jgi:hypothetical protein
VPVISGSSVTATIPLTEDYSRTMLLLHWPNWRKLEDIKPSEITWCQKLQEFLTSDTCPNFLKADIEKAQQKAYDNIPSDDTSDSDNDIEMPEWMQLLQPNKKFQSLAEFDFDDGGPEYDWNYPDTQYPDDFGIKWLENIDSEENTTIPIISEIKLHSLNYDQRLAFCIVMNTLIHYKNGSDVDPLRLIISGTAGSGKSFLISCLVEAIQNLFQNNKSVQVLCPTGNSANLISGKTIHDFFKIPTGFQAKREMSAPDGNRGDIIKKNCIDLTTLIVDERSLVGATTLGWMEFLCRHDVGDTKSTWGGLPVVIFLGDDIQLPPVCDSPVYNVSTKSPASIHGQLVWKSFQNVIQLNTIVRQDEHQKQLKGVLNSLREYKCSEEQVKWLQQFQWDDLKIKYDNHILSNMTEYGLFVFQLNISTL